jgi:hypothetical protein
MTLMLQRILLLHPVNDVQPAKLAGLRNGYFPFTEMPKVLPLVCHGKWIPTARKAFSWASALLVVAFSRSTAPTEPQYHWHEAADCLDFSVNGEPNFVTETIINGSLTAEEANRLANDHAFPV